MEHRFIRNILTISCFLTLAACEKPLAEPELVDPIYQDLKSSQASAEKLAEDKKKELESVQASLDKPESEMSPVERKHTRQQIFTSQKTLSLMDQDARYFKLRAETRKAVDRDTYPLIFKNKGKWPNLEEAEAYKAEKRLREASRNWNDRVPRPANAPTKDNPTGEKKIETKGEGKSEGGDKKETEKKE